MLPIDHLSYSSIQTYLTCPEHWRRKYIDRRPTRATPPLAFGKAVHGTLSEALRLPREERTPDLLARVWDIQWGGAEATEDVEWGDEGPDAHQLIGHKLITAPDVARLLSSIDALEEELGPAIERPVTLEVPGVPVPIIGYVDLITADGVPTEFKTSAAAWPEGKPAAETQPLFYLAALEQEGIVSPGNLFRYHVLTKTKTPKLQSLEHRYPANRDWLFGMIRRVWWAIESEAYYPNPSAWLCSAKGCAFWSECRGAGQ